MKKLVSLLLAAMMVVAVFAGCSNNESKSEENTVKITTSADLAGKKIGVQQGTTGDTEASEIEGAEVSRYSKPTDAAMDLKNGKIDAIVLDAMPAQKIVDSMDGLVILDEELTKEEYAIAVPKGDTELLESINKTLARLKEDGTMDLLNEVFIDGTKEMSELPTVDDSAFTDTIVMGTNAAFEPFEYKETSDEIVGYDVVLAQQIAKDLGMKLKIEDMEFDSLPMALSSGKVDFVAAGMSVTEEKKQTLDFSDPYFNASQVIIVRAESAK